MRLEYKDENSHKFWSVARRENVLVLRWGKAESKGQTKEKLYESNSEAEKDLNRLVQEKTKKGYKVCDSDIEIRPQENEISTKKEKKSVTKVKLPDVQVEMEFSKELERAIYALKAEDLEELWKKQEISAVHIIFADPAKMLKSLIGKLPSRTSMQWEPKFKAGIIKASTRQPIEVFGGEHARYWLRFNPYRLTPDTLHKWLVSHTWERVRAAYHKDCPLIALKKLAVDKTSSVREAVVANENCTDDLQYTILNNTKMSTLVEKIGYLSTAMLNRLAESEHKVIRSAALSNTNHPRWQKTLYEDIESNPWFISLVCSLDKHAKNALSNRDLSYFPGESRDKAIRSTREIAKAIALWKDCAASEDLLTKTMKHKGRLVRCAVAMHPNITQDLLKKLATDKDSLVSACAIARLPANDMHKTGSEARIKERDSVVKKGPSKRKAQRKPPINKRYWEVAAINSETPSDILMMSLEEKILKKFPTIPADLQAHKRHLDDFLDHPQCTRNTLKQIIELSSASNIPFGLAKHPKITGKLLEIFAKKTTSFGDLEEIAMSPKCPATLFPYIYDKSGPLAAKQAIRSGMGIDWRLSMTRHLASHPKCQKSILSDISNHYEIEVRVLVASNPNTEPEVLTKLAKVRSVQIKRGLLANPKLPEDIKKKIKI